MNEPQAWPRVMEGDLRRQDIPATVYNAGVDGYESRQQLIRYRRHRAGLGADLVTIYMGWNGVGALVDRNGIPARRGTEWQRSLRARTATPLNH